jgi:hypothetical protein
MNRNELSNKLISSNGFDGGLSSEGNSDGGLATLLYFGNVNKK